MIIYTIYVHTQEKIIIILCKCNCINSASILLYRQMKIFKRNLIKSPKKLLEDHHKSTSYYKLHDANDISTMRVRVF